MQQCCYRFCRPPLLTDLCASIVHYSWVCAYSVCNRAPQSPSYNLAVIWRQAAPTLPPPPSAALYTEFCALRNCPRQFCALSLAVMRSCTLAASSKVAAIWQAAASRPPLPLPLLAQPFTGFAHLYAISNGFAHSQPRTVRCSR